MHTAPLPEAVAEVILRQYHSLPKTGKPQPNEHSVLAGFAISLDEKTHDTCEGPATQPGCCGLVTVALGTGTKCVGSRQDRHQIDVINDSHAEVSLNCADCRHDGPLLHPRYAALVSWAVSEEAGLARY